MLCQKLKISEKLRKIGQPQKILQRTQDSHNITTQPDPTQPKHPHPPRFLTLSASFSQPASSPLSPSFSILFHFVVYLLLFLPPLFLPTNFIRLVERCSRSGFTTCFCNDAGVWICLCSSFGNQCITHLSLILNTHTQTCTHIPFCIRFLSLWTRSLPTVLHIISSLFTFSFYFSFTPQCSLLLSHITSPQAQLHQCCSIRKSNKNKKVGWTCTSFFSFYVTYLGHHCSCPVYRSVRIIFGKWKLSWLMNLSHEVQRKWKS